MSLKNNFFLALVLAAFVITLMPASSFADDTTATEPKQNVDANASLSARASMDETNEDLNLTDEEMDEEDEALDADAEQEEEMMQEQAADSAPAEVAKP